MPRAERVSVPEHPVRRHIRHRVLSGLALLVPVGITWFVLSLLYRASVGVVSSVIQPILPNLPKWAITGLSFVGLGVALYFLGFLATNVLGRRFIGLVEKLFARIPLLDSIYGTSKQIVEMFRSESGVGKRNAVLVPFPNAHTWIVGFMTGTVSFHEGKPMATVFIPTTPNPTTGFLQFFPAEDVVELDWDTDETIQFIMSGGLIRPESLGNDSPK